MGTSLRYKFNGYLQSMSAASTMAFVPTHGAALTQTIFSITFTSATNPGWISGEFHIMISSIGTSTNPIIDGFVSYLDGTTQKYTVIQTGSWTSALYTTIRNSFAMSCNVTGSTVQFIINNFTMSKYDNS